MGNRFVPGFVGGEFGANIASKGLESAGIAIGFGVNDGLIKLGLTLGISLGTFILLSTIINANSGRGRGRNGRRSRSSRNYDGDIDESTDDEHNHGHKLGTENKNSSEKSDFDLGKEHEPRFNSRHTE